MMNLPFLQRGAPQQVRHPIQILFSLKHSNISLLVLNSVLVAANTRRAWSHPWKRRAALLCTRYSSDKQWLQIIQWCLIIGWYWVDPFWVEKQRVWSRDWCGFASLLPDSNWHNSSQDYIIMPQEAKWQKVPECSTGRVFLLDYGTDARRHFYWMQVIFHFSTWNCSNCNFLGTK